jgi:multiple antibiotic resistance protein
MDDDAKERSRISLWTAINVFINYILFFREYVPFFGISIEASALRGIVIATSGFTIDW